MCVNVWCVGGCSGSQNKCVHVPFCEHTSVWLACVKLSGICFSVDGKAGFHVATLNCCQSIHETGSKQWTWCDDKHE